MCLMLELELPGLSRKKAGEITREAAREGLLTLHADRVPKKVEACRFRVTTGFNECACGLLDNVREDNGGPIELKRQELPRLVRTIR